MGNHSGKEPSADGYLAEKKLLSICGVIPVFACMQTLKTV